MLTPVMMSAQRRQVAKTTHLRPNGMKGAGSLLRSARYRPYTARCPRTPSGRMRSARL
jgi:hypothetical protein